MRDREVINRFCGFYLFGIDEYRKDMDDFLGDTLKKINKFDQTKLDQLETYFLRSMKNCYLLFDQDGFRRRKLQENKRSLINVGLFDVFATLMGKYSESQIEQARETLRQKFYEIQEQEEFVNSIYLGTNQVSKVRTRFEWIERMLNEVIPDVK